MHREHDWEYYGRNDPYFGVLTDPKYRRDSLDEAAREAFFELGTNYVGHALEVVRTHLDANFRPTRALDFGCGVGRLALPLARICASVVGVDVSVSMLEEARKNANRLGIANVEFVESDPALTRVQGDFDFLNSLIVFQHIPVRVGERIFRRMVGMLREGGVGALQFTYAHAEGTAAARRALTEAYRVLPGLWSVRNLAKGRPFREPHMQMNRYDINRLLRILQQSNCHDVHLRFSETSSFGNGVYGVTLFFKKTRLETGAHA